MNLHKRLSKNRFIMISGAAITIVLAVILVFGIKDSDIGRFDEKHIENEVDITCTTVNLEVVDKTRRFNIFSLTYPPSHSYFVKVSSEDPLYDGVTISVSESMYEKYIVGNEYEFQLTETKRIKRKIEALK